MFGFNWIDLISLLLLALAVYGGLRIGFLRLSFLLGGFFGALFLGGWLFHRLLPINDKTLLTIINGNLVLIFAVFVALKGYDLGKRLHFSLSNSGLRSLESVTGVTLSVGSALIIIWLISAQLGTLPFAGLSNSASDALIVQALNRHVPAAPAVFAQFNRLVDPNAPPRLFIKKAPGASLGISPAPAANPAVSRTGESVVRITSFGCGGITGGSGFVAAPQLVATNAHVVAGVKRPIVKYGAKSLEGVPVVFNSSLDFAVLRVKGLTARPVALAGSNVVAGSPVYVSGYPDGNYTLVPGMVRNNFELFGTNIYSIGRIGRDTYEIQAAVEAGNSGGPVILPDGRVAGMIFAKSDLVAGYGYAITSPSLTAGIQKAEKSYRRVSTGTCYS
jgi:S1-C subfamily serine protease